MAFSIILNEYCLAVWGPAHESRSRFETRRQFHQTTRHKCSECSGPAHCVDRRGGPGNSDRFDGPAAGISSQLDLGKRRRRCKTHARKRTNLLHASAVSGSRDGTYRELVRHLRREKIDVSVIIVSAPTCPNEYGDYLAAMNIGALDFLCYPYRPFDFERMLESAIATSSGSSHRQSIENGRDLRERGAA